MNEPPPSTEVTAPANPQIRNVTRANARQLRILRAAFQTTFATPKVLTELEEQTGLPSKWISAWFNRERRKVSKLQAAATAVKSEHAENLHPSSEAPTTRPNEEDRQAKKQKTTLMTTARLSSPQHQNRLADSRAASLVDIKREQAANYNGYMLFPPIKEVIVVDAPPAVTHLRKPTAVAAPRKSVLMSTSAHNTPNTLRPPAETDKDDTISIALDPAGDHNHETQPLPAQTCADDILAVPPHSDLPLPPDTCCLPSSAYCP
ncbi:hypothetical protein ONZ45_g11529 [Pleurotus djamor]|nr:hypothetical protein ONZ45_g11529 [Pleurotus djamor]